MKLKTLFILSTLLILIWFAKANTELEVYKKLIDLNILTASEATNIHNNLETNQNCQILNWQWYIALQWSKIIRIWITYCTQLELKYLLLHEIWHYKYNSNKVSVPLVITNYSKRYTGDLYLEEVYAESFTRFYFK